MFLKFAESPHAPRRCQSELALGQQTLYRRAAIVPLFHCKGSRLSDTARRAYLEAAACRSAGFGESSARRRPFSLRLSEAQKRSLPLQVPPGSRPCQRSTPRLSVALTHRAPSESTRHARDKAREARARSENFKETTGLRHIGPGRRTVTEVPLLPGGHNHLPLGLPAHGKRKRKRSRPTHDLPPTPRSPFRASPRDWQVLPETEGLRNWTRRRAPGDTARHLPDNMMTGGIKAALSLIEWAIAGIRINGGGGETLPFLSYWDPWQRQMNLFSACPGALGIRCEVSSRH